MALKPDEVYLGMCYYSLKAQLRRLDLSSRWPNPPDIYMYMTVIINIMIQWILCRYNTGGSTNMTLLSTDWICDIKQTQQCHPTTSFIIIVTGPHIVHWRWYFPLSEHEYSSEDVGLTSLNLFHVASSVCGYQCHVLTTTSIIQAHNWPDLLLSMIRELCSYQGGSSRLLDRPSLLNRAFNHFKL